MAKEFGDMTAVAEPTLEQAIADVVERYCNLAKTSTRCRDELMLILRKYGLTDRQIGLTLATAIEALGMHGSLWRGLLYMLAEFAHKYTISVQFEMSEAGQGFAADIEAAQVAALQQHANMVKKLHDLRGCECREIRALLADWVAFVRIAYLRFKHGLHYQDQDPEYDPRTVAEPFFARLCSPPA